MNSNVRWIAVLVGAVALVAGGGVLALVLFSSDEGAGDRTAEPRTTTHIIEVVIEDRAPSDVYFSRRDRCTFYNIFGEGEPLNITVRNEDGTIIGSKDSPLLSGVVVPEVSCTVTVKLAVETSESYEVSLTGGTTPTDEVRTAAHEGDDRQTFTFTL